MKSTRFREPCRSFPGQTKKRRNLTILAIVYVGPRSVVTKSRKEETTWRNVRTPTAPALHPVGVPIHGALWSPQAITTRPQ